MRVSTKLLAALSAVCVTSCMVMAKEPTKIQAYAHPTMFGSQAQTLVNAESDAIIGGKVYKPCQAKTMEGKENVIIGKLLPSGTGMKCYSDVELKKTISDVVSAEA